MRVLVLTLSLLLSGCVTELIADPDLTVRTFACAVIAGPQSLVIVQHGSDPNLVLPSVVTAVAEGIGREGNPPKIERRSAAAPDDLLSWAQNLDVLERQTVRLHVAFVEVLPENQTTATLAPGVVAFAKRTAGQVSDDYAVHVALLMHSIGHTLGVVNRGIPINATSSYESSPGHASSSASVMHQLWHRGNGYEGQAAPATYGADERADWQRARAPGGVCA